MTLRPCLVPGCANYAQAGKARCVLHHRRRREEEGLTGARGTTASWRKARHEALVRDRFRCVRCGGVAAAVHHVNGLADDDRLENLESLCRAHHLAAHKPAQNHRHA